MISETNKIILSPNSPRFSNGFIKLMSAHAYQSSLPKIIHINGENASGKSTLLREFIRYHTPLSSFPIYIADNEGGLSPSNLRKLFPTKTLELNKIYYFPCRTIHDLNQLLDSISLGPNNRSYGPILIINSFSRMLKATIGMIDNYSDYIHALHAICDHLLPKLSNLAIRKKILIILVHHVSFNRDYQATTPYFANLMNLLQGSWITLETTNLSPKKSIRTITFSNVLEEKINGKIKLRRTYHKRQYILSQGRFFIFNTEYSA